MKFPYLTALGKDDGWYRVGPLARVNNCDYIDTPLAEEMSFRKSRDSPTHIITGGRNDQVCFSHNIVFIDLIVMK
jgi:coenzyme F420-reducing hydrogenase alpha subunit